MHEIRDGTFIFKGNLLSRLPKPVELTHKWIKKIFKYQEPVPTLRRIRLEVGNYEFIFGQISDVLD